MILMQNKGGTMFKVPYRYIIYLGRYTAQEIRTISTTFNVIEIQE